MNEKSTALGNRIRDLRKKKLDISAKQLGSLLTPTRGEKAIWSWETNRTRPNLSYLQQLCSIFQVSPEDLLGDPHVFEDSEDNSVKLVPVPLLGSIAAGQAIEMITIDGTIPVLQSITKRHPKAYLLWIKGDSMNKLFADGSLVLVDPEQTEPLDNQVYAFSFDKQEATVKRLRLYSDRFELVPESWDTQYVKNVYLRDSRKSRLLSILGRIVWHIPAYTGKY